MIGSINSTADGKVFEINLDPQVPIGALGKNYTITVRNVKSVNGILMTLGAGNTIGFVFSDSDLERTIVYPNPFSQSRDERMYFAMLAPRCEVIIMTLSGEILNILIENDGNGGVEWDGRDSGGNRLSSGIYLYKVVVTDADGSRRESELNKFAIIK